MINILFISKPHCIKPQPILYEHILLPCLYLCMPVHSKLVSNHFVKIVLDFITVRLLVSLIYTRGYVPRKGRYKQIPYKQYTFP